jgi:hypothetical protein
MLEQGAEHFFRAITEKNPSLKAALLEIEARYERAAGILRLDFSGEDQRRTGDFVGPESKVPSSHSALGASSNEVSRISRKGEPAATSEDSDSISRA